MARTSPGVRFPPLLIYVIGYCIGWLCGRVLPLPILSGGRNVVTTVIGWLLIVSVVHPVVELRGSRCDRCWDLASLGSPGRRLNQSTSGLMSTLVRVRILPIILPIIGSELRGV